VASPVARAWAAEEMAARAESAIRRNQGKATNAAGTEDSTLQQQIESPPPVPRWVKVLGIVAAMLILLAIGAMALVGGEHGPGRHLHGRHAAASGLARSVSP